MSELSRIASIERGFSELKRSLIDIITMVRVLESDFTDLRLELVQSTAIPASAPMPLSRMAEEMPPMEAVKPAELSEQTAQEVPEVAVDVRTKGQRGRLALDEWRKHRTPSSSPSALYNRDLRRRKQEAKAAGEPFRQLPRGGLSHQPKPKSTPNAHWRGGLPPIIPAMEQQRMAEEAAKEDALETAVEAAIVPEGVKADLPEMEAAVAPVRDGDPLALPPIPGRLGPKGKRHSGLHGQIPKELLTGPMPRFDTSKMTANEKLEHARWIKAIGNARYRAKKERQSETMRQAPATTPEVEPPFPQGMRRRIGNKHFMLQRHEKLAREKERVLEDRAMQRQADHEKKKQKLANETLNQWNGWTAKKADLRGKKGYATGNRKSRHHKRQLELI